jgi:hypothetical protein
MTVIEGLLNLVMLALKDIYGIYVCVVCSINTHLKVLHYYIFIQVMLYIHAPYFNLSYFVDVAFSISL